MRFCWQILLSHKSYYKIFGNNSLNYMQEEEAVDALYSPVCHSFPASSLINMPYVSIDYLCTNGNEIGCKTKLH